MRTLKDHTLLYDEACPMCKFYTKGFQKAGMLDGNGRHPYQDMPDNFTCLVDQKRYVDEIALIDKRSGKVYYGVESLLTILVHSFPVLKPVLQNKTFVGCADKLYKFISFNRRVIIPAEKREIQEPGFNPSFHQGYRLAYLFFAVFVSAACLYLYSNRLIAILPGGSFSRELLICCGQLVWQGAAVSIFTPGKSWDYLGNLMTISFGGSLLLGLTLFFGNLISMQNVWFYLAAFGTTIFLMLLEHIRRTRVLALSWKLSVSWILYRVVVLVILIFLNHVG